MQVSDDNVKGQVRAAVPYPPYRRESMIDNCADYLAATVWMNAGRNVDSKTIGHRMHNI